MLLVLYLIDSTDRNTRASQTVLYHLPLSSVGVVQPEYLISSTEADKHETSTAYSTEEADVTLVSKEGVQFKVFSYYLKANSAIFRDMLTDGAFQDSNIPLDVVQTDLHYFLDLMHQAEPRSPHNWQQASSIVALCDKFDCPIVLERILHRLEGLAESQPWDIFCLASQYNQLPLAKVAIRSMWRDKVYATAEVDTIPIKYAAQVALPYLLALFGAKKSTKIPDMYYNNASYNDTLAINWEAIAKAFKPPV
ncbi:hypothetical protein IAT40_004309 [Kwoniella sp. CBS 6097]